jgi:hypothetical protein
MFASISPVSPHTVSGLSFQPAQNWLYAKSQIWIEAVRSEAKELSTYYPLVFSPEENSRLMAVMGKGEKNVFIDDEGRWRVPVIPARLRSYPFTLALAAPGSYTLAADLTAPQFVKEGGEAIFDAKEEPAEFVSKAFEFAKLVLQDGIVTQQLVAQLEAAGLLGERMISVSKPDGGTETFAGFKAVVPERLNALDETSRNALQKSGALALLEAHQESLKNFSRLMAY